VVHNKEIFLVTLSSLEGPVEGASHHEYVIDYDELVVHVELLSIISSDRDALASHELDVTALVLHALIISDDLHVHIGIPSVNDCIAEIIIGEIKDTDFETSLSFHQVRADFVDVLDFGEEECVDVPWLGDEQVILNSTNHLSQAFENLLVVVIFHFVFSNGEESGDYLVNIGLLMLVWHLYYDSGEIVQICFVAFKFG
jgi:hypothetical protein